MSTRTSNGHVIDEYVPLKASEIVLCSNGDPYSCILNQTDIKTNANKFYIMQVLREDGLNPSYYTYIRYGRIGEKGILSYKSEGTKEDNISKFESQFKTKTKNNWSDRGDFVPYKGKYFLSKISEKISIDTPTIQASPGQALPSKALPAALVPYHDDVVNFLSLISDKTMLRNAMIDMEIDIEKMPLGKINVDHLHKARDLVLDLQKRKSTMSEGDIQDISSLYYTYVPYSCGRSKPPVISSADQISKCLQRLEDLENISINVRAVEGPEVTGNPLVDLYSSLKTEITPLDPGSKVYGYIRDYIKNTHGGTHRFKLELFKIFEIHRPEGRSRFNATFGKTQNRELLIHGSRMCNWVSILKNGLLLDPSKIGAVITGKMFGYGIYWANSFSKSAQYCGHSGGRNREIICFTLAEVALGNEYQLKSSESSMTGAKLKKYGDYQSVHGMGKHIPSKYVEHDGMKIPVGKLERRGDDCCLQYDEKIVYHPDQFDLRYIVLAEMNY